MREPLMRAPRLADDHSPARLLRATLDAVPDAVIIVDADGVIQTANEQVRSVFGYAPSELEGRQMELLVPARVRSNHPTRRTSYTHRPMGLLQLAAVRKDGVEFPAEISLAPIDFPGGRLTAATVRDITVRLALEAESERMRDELLATVTHELRTPLTSIIGYAEVLADLPDSDLSPRARRMLEAISRNAARELNLVTDLLFLAVGALGEMDLELAPVHVAPVIEAALADHRAQALNFGVNLEASAQSAASASGLAVLGDAVRLRQVVDNLISNAIKFTPPEGTVTVGAHALGDSVIVSVTDTGVGIDPSEQPRVFERLYRAANATASVTPGAGLGLAIAAEIVKAHKGTIGLSSTLGGGTSVTCQLPRLTVAARSA